jgi:uncharacterized C2H2 Zn-finger protein
MDCREAKESLSAFIDGALPEAEASRIGEHLARCPGCRETFETMSRIASQMHLMEHVDEPEQFAERVGERMKRRFYRAGIFRRLFVPPYVKLPLEAVAVAAVALLMIYALGNRDGQTMYEITVSLGPGSDSGIVERRGPKKGFGKDKGEREGTEQQPSFETLIASLGGRVVKSDYAESAVTPSSLTIEIRASDYSTLLARLSRFGVVEEPYGGIAEGGDEPIRVKISFQHATGGAE